MAMMDVDNIAAYRWI